MMMVVVLASRCRRGGAGRAGAGRCCRAARAGTLYRISASSLMSLRRLVECAHSEGRPAPRVPRCLRRVPAPSASAWCGSPPTRVAPPSLKTAS
eukprot:COSAG02_NODE_3820_length_6190_cov_1.860121_2_plen_94_part_00